MQLGENLLLKAAVKPGKLEGTKINPACPVAPIQYINHQLCRNPTRSPIPHKATRPHHWT